VGHAETVTALDSHAQSALSATVGKEVRLWNLRTGECAKRVTIAQQSVNWVKLHPDHVKSVLFTQNQDLIWLDLEEGKPAHTVRLPGVSLIAATRDWNYALLGGSPGQPCLSVWDLNQGKLVADEKKFQAALKKFQATNSAPLPTSLQITALCVLDGSDGFALTASQDGFIRLWDLNIFRCLKEFKTTPEAGAVTALAWSKDGDHFVAGHAKGGLRVWAIKDTQGPLKSVDGHWGKVLHAALSGEARFLLTVLEDRTLRFWELDWELDPVAPPRTLRATYPRPGFWARLFSRA
jgi:WD40 repeat protein